MKIKSIIAIMCITIAGSASAQLKYPATRTDASVVDDYFGMKVADPYRWLEDDNSAETAEWVKAQNAVTGAYLQKIPFRNALKNRLTRPEELRGFQWEGFALDESRSTDTHLLFTA